ADLYGQHVAVDFVARIRPQEKFDSVDDLIVAMGGDTEKARAILRDSF
ncbi:MAG TPA: riboflavin kinase, partial [Mycobacterium sp.]